MENDYVVIELVRYIDMMNRIFNRRFKTNIKYVPTMRQRLKEGYTLNDFERAILNAANDTHHIENGFKYCTPEFFLRIKRVKNLNNK